MARFALFLMVMTVAVPAVWSESSDCSAPVIIVADGRITESSFANNSTYWYGIHAQAGHSYSVEFVPAADNYADPARVQIGMPMVFGPGDSLTGCHGNSSLQVTHNSAYAPGIFKNGNGAGRRISFVASNTGLHIIAVTNGGGSGSYSFRAVDTTLLNIRWSTAGGYEDQWGFLNISDMPITGILTVYDASNHPVTSVQFAIPPNGEVVRYSNGADLNLPRNLSGYAILAHNGPPNSLVADAYMISPNGTLVVPSKFSAIGDR